MNNKRVKRLKSLIENEGLTVLDIHHHRHYKITVMLPSGETRMLVAPYSPSDGRAFKNFRAGVRRLARGQHI